jgi:hypothetical protein
VVEDHTFQPYRGATDDLSVMDLMSSPVFREDADPGVNWHCPGCETLLAEAVYPGQFLDLLFRCRMCDTLSASANKRPGQPLAGRPIICAPGQFYLKGVVDVAGKPSLLAGSSARDAYLYETSAEPIPFSGGQEISAPFLNELASRASNLLGAAYSRLRASDDRARSSPTPRATRHRLTELIAYAEELADAVDEQSSGSFVPVDGDRIIELLATVQMFDRWRNHPAWPELVNALASENEGPHSLMLLSAASYLSDSGNGVGIVSQGGKGRIPDLWIEPTLIERLNVEIKTPAALRGFKGLAISAVEAEKVIERQVNKAASAKRGQLDPARSGVLAIGAFHLPAGKLEALVSATQRVLARQAKENRKPHLAGVLVSAFGYNVLRLPTERGRQQLNTFMENRFVRHPGYKGDLTIDQSQPRWRTAPFSGG